MSLLPPAEYRLAAVTIVLPLVTLVPDAIVKPQLTITSLPVGRKRKDTFPVKPAGRAVPVYVTQPVCPGSVLSPLLFPTNSTMFLLLFDAVNLVPAAPKFSAP
jgi:hypothetical protein